MKRGIPNQHQGSWITSANQKKGRGTAEPDDKGVPVAFPRVSPIPSPAGILAANGAAALQPC